MTTLTSRIVLRPFRMAGLAALAAAAIVSSPLAQGVSPDDVVATVDGEPITNADLALAAAEFGDQIAQVAPDRQEAALLDLVINIRLASKAARAEGLETEAAVIRRLDLARDRTLYSEYLRKKFIAAVTEEAVRARFEEELAAFVPEDEVRARHILVRTEAEAKAIIAELDAGADFAALAAEKSLDTGSGRVGGDLGFFTHGRMVAPFEEAAFKLKPGKYTKKPVQTDFGWHVILVEETRKEPPPTFAEESPRIQQEMIRDTFEAEMEALRASASIETGGPAQN